MGYSDASLAGLKAVIAPVAPFPLLTPSQLLLAAAVAEYYLTDMRRILRRMTPPAVPVADPRATAAVVGVGGEGGPPRRPAAAVAEALAADGYRVSERLSGPPAIDEGRMADSEVLLVRHPPGCPPARHLAEVLAEIAARGGSSIVALGSTLMRDSRAVREAVGSTAFFVETSAPARRRTAQWVEASSPGSTILGDRSVVFHRASNLEAVVVMDEAGPNLREERAPYYNARTVAMLRCAVEGADGVLAAPWPSYESRCAATRLAAADWKSAAARSPVVEVVDRSKELPEPGFIAAKTARLVRDCLESGGRALFFLTRKGGYRAARCRDCWFVMEDARAVACARCGSSRVKPTAPGTDAIAEEARRLFPRARVEKVSADRGDFDPTAPVVVATEAALWRLGGADVVVVVSVESLVGLVSFDAWFRSARILADLAGLAAASRLQPGGGRLILQTFDPSHPVVASLVTGDERVEVGPDLEARAAEGWPPFSRAVLVETAEEPGRKLVEDFVDELSQRRYDGEPPVLVGPHTEGECSRLVVLHDGRTSLWDAFDSLKKRAEAERARLRIEVDPDASYRQL